jgi:hypothetical protein
MAGKGDNEKPKPKTPENPPKAVDSKKKLSTFSDIVSGKIFSDKLADLADRTGLSLVGELKTDLEREVNIRRVKYYLKEAGRFESELSVFIPEEKRREEYIAVLVDLLGNIGGDRFKDFIKELDSYLWGEYFSEKDRQDSRKTKFLSDNLFNISCLKELFEASKLAPDDIVFLGEKYLCQPYINRSYTEKERIKETDKENYAERDKVRSFTLAEMVKLLKEHGKAGKTIIEFVDMQILSRNFKYRKNFILQHLEQFKKIESYFRDGSYFSEDAINFNLDLLEDGDHMETLRKLLGLDSEESLSVIKSPCELFLDRAYIKNYAEKLFAINGALGETLYLPTKDEMRKNGDLMVEIAKTAHGLPCNENAEYHVTEMDKKIFQAFGWASDPVFNSEENEKKILLEKISLPENKELSNELREIFLALEGRNDDLRQFMAETLCVVLLVPEKRDVVKTFIDNYKKYPRIVGAVLVKIPVFEDETLSSINIIISDLESKIEGSADYEKISELFEWIPWFPRLSDGLQDVREMITSQWTMDVIYRNRGFLNSYKTSSYGIQFPELVYDFPLQLLDTHKDQLLELAEKYNDGGTTVGLVTLRALLFCKIHSEVDLQFYIKNSDKILSWYKKLLEFGGGEGVGQLSPSRPFLEAHLDDVINLTNQLRLERGADVLKFFEYLNDDFVRDNWGMFSQLVGKAGDLSSRDLLAGREGKILPRDLSNLGDTLKSVDATFPKHKDKIQFIISKFIRGSGPIAVSDVLDFIEKNPELLEKSWGDLKSILEIFPNGTLSPVVIVLLMKRLLSGRKPDVMKKIIKLFVIDGYSGYSDRKDQMLIDILSDVGLKFHGENIAEIIDNFFEGHGDLPDKSDKENYEKYLLALDNLMRSLLFVFGSRTVATTWPMIEPLKEYGGYIDENDLRVIVFLQKTGCDQKIIEEFIEGTEDAYDNSEETGRRRTQYLLTDHSDNSDLRKFDYKKIHLYEALFAFTRRGGWTGVEDTLIKSLDISAFKKEMSGKNIFEIEGVITTCSNRTDPRLGYLLFKEIILPKLKDGSLVGKTLLSWGGKNATGEIVKIDVTQNNLSTINTILRMFGIISKLINSGRLDSGVGMDIIASNIKVVFPGFQSTGNPTADIRWFFEKFDVEEINFKKLDSLVEFIEFQQLLSSMSENKIESSARYLENSMKDIDFSNMFFEGTDYSIFDVKKIEQLRQLLNAKNRIIGDMLIDMIGSKFLETNCCEYKTIGKLIEFAHTWENPRLDRDVNGLYQVYSTYAFVEIGAFIKENIEKGGPGKNREMVERKLKDAGVNAEQIIKELEEKGYLMLTPSNSQKAVSALKDGFYAYTFRKGVSKLLGEESVEFEGKRVKIKESDWVKRDGVKVYSLVEGGKEIAKVIKCDPSKVKVKVLAEPDGIVNMDAEARTLGRKLIFSAPLTFTTGARKMTELAFRDGVQMNYLLSPYSKDGFLLVNQNGERKVLNKKRLKISDVIMADDLQNEEIREALIKWANGSKIDILGSDGQVSVTKLVELLKMDINPVRRFLDKNTFFALIRAKKYSLLGGMLLIDKEEGKDEGTVVRLNDAGDSRRFYLEFEDGQFGIIDSTESISSGKLVELALSVGATKAIYMDTGMYDMAAYQDGGGKTHIMGHMDTSESTNRVVIYEK